MLLCRYKIYVEDIVHCIMRFSASFSMLISQPPLAIRRLQVQICEGGGGELLTLDNTAGARESFT